MRLVTLIIVIVLMVVVVTTSFAQADKLEPLPITESRNAAVGFALTQTALVVDVINRCKEVPGLSKNPVEVFSRWQQRNGPYFEGAKGWVMYVASSIKAKQGQEKADDFTKTIVNQARQSAEMTTKKFFSGKEPPPEVCDKWLGILSSQQSDILASQEFRGDLQDILKFHKSVLSRYKEGHAVPTPSASR